MKFTSAVVCAYSIFLMACTEDAGSGDSIVKNSARPSQAVNPLGKIKSTTGYPDLVTLAAAKGNVALTVREHIVKGDPSSIAQMARQVARLIPESETAYEAAHSLGQASTETLIQAAAHSPPAGAASAQLEVLHTVRDAFRELPSQLREIAVHAFGKKAAESIINPADVIMQVMGDSSLFAAFRTESYGSEFYPVLVNRSLEAGQAEQLMELFKSGNKSMPEDQLDVYSYMLFYTVTNWAATHPEEASTYVDTLPTGWLKDGSIAALMPTIMASNDKEGGEAWIAKVSDPELRGQLTTALTKVP